jgi:radical SAM superfamily enzyme YgiQ (UPF0313 family)
MKIAFVNPIFSSTVWAPTFGLGFMATYIKKRTDWDVAVIEPGLEKLTPEQTAQRVMDADIVGLTCYTESRFDCFDFAESVRRRNPACRIIVGGPHVNTLDTLIIKHYPFIDGVVRMEGEETILEIVKGTPFAGIAGLTWRDGAAAVRNPDRPLMPDVSAVEYDYALIRHQIKDWKDFEVPHHLINRVHMPIIASRGCPFYCAYCAAHPQWGNVYRGISPQKCVDNLEYLAKEYGAGYFRFYDALFTRSGDETLEFCDILEKRKLDIRFRIDIRAGTPTSYLKRLREVGCDVVGFGVESGSDRILKRLTKGITRQMVLQTVEDCKTLGFWTIGFFMVSLPGEQKEDVRLSFDLFKYFDGYNFQFFKLHPNIKIYAELKQQDEIDDEIWFDKSRGREIFYCSDNFKSAVFDKQSVILTLHKTYLDFYTHNPALTFKKYGPIKGCAIIIMSGAISTALRTPVGRKIFFALKDSRAYKNFVAFCRRFSPK